MAYQINAVNIPQSIYDNGTAVPPDREALALNGQGTAIEPRVKIFTWAWNSLSKADYEWWTQTILADALSLRCAARLPNRTWVETAYSVVIVRKPTTAGLKYGRYWNVELTIEILS